MFRKAVSIEVIWLQLEIIEKHKTLLTRRFFSATCLLKLVKASIEINGMNWKNTFANSLVKAATFTFVPDRFTFQSYTIFCRQKDLLRNLFWYIICRPVSDGRMFVSYQVIGTNHVAVPTHFFKVIAIENVDGNFSVESYILPNQPIDSAAPLSAFQIQLESIERAAGFHIFDKLPKSQVKLLNGKKV